MKIGLGIDISLAAQKQKVPLVFLLNDQFTTPASAPLTSPRTAEPGPGTLTLVQNDGEFSISGDKLVIPAQSSPVWDDQKAYIQVDRLAGIVWMVQTNFADLSTGEIICLDDWTTGLTTAAAKNALYMGVSGSLRIQNTAIWEAGSYAALTDYKIAVLLLNEGCLIYIKGGAFTDWTLLWHRTDDLATTLYAMLSNYQVATTHDFLKLADLSPAAGQPHEIPTVGLDLCSPGTGPGTSHMVFPPNGGSFVHSVNTKIEFTMIGLPPNGEFFSYRGKAGQLGYLFAINSAGNVSILDGATFGVLLTSAAAVSGTEFVELVVDGTTQTLYIDGVLIGTFDDSLYTGTIGLFQPPFPPPNYMSFAPFSARTLDTKNGLCTDILPGPMSNGDTFTHAADGFIEVKVGALPSTGSATIDHAFRQKDGTHRWIVRYDDAGNLYLIEDNAGETARITGATVLSGGETLRWYFKDNVYRLYYNNTALTPYTDSSNLFKTETSGNIAVSAEGYSADLVAFDQSAGELLAALTAVEKG